MAESAERKASGADGKNAQARQDAAGYRSLTGRQKAAIFLVSLGSAAASEIMKHLKSDEVDALTLEIARLGAVEADYKDMAREEFRSLSRAQALAASGNEGAARDLLEKAFGAEKAESILASLTGKVSRPFDSLRRIDPADLLNFVKQESPQTIALILAHLEPETAAEVLENLPQDVQSGVFVRLATTDKTSPEVLREVGRALEKRLAALPGALSSAPGGVDTAAEILSRVGRSSGNTIIATLEKDNPALAKAIKEKMFSFEDITALDDRAIQRLLREINARELRQDLAAALKTADPEVQDKVFRNMSRRDASRLEESMERMRTLERRDVDESRRRIVKIIREGVAEKR